MGFFSVSAGFVWLSAGFFWVFAGLFGKSMMTCDETNVSAVAVGAGMRIKEEFSKVSSMVISHSQFSRE